MTKQTTWLCYECGKMVKGDCWLVWIEGIGWPMCDSCKDNSSHSADLIQRYPENRC